MLPQFFRSRRLLGALLAVLITGCATFQYEEEVIYLEGTTWRIVRVDHQTARKGDNLDLAPHIRILSEEGRAHGGTGCNRFSADYRSTGTALSFGAFAVTRAMCGDAESQQLEDTILEILGAVDSYRLEGDWLWLFVGGEHRMTLEVW